MTCSLILAIALTTSEPANDYFLPPVPVDEAIKVPELAAKADISYLVRRWDRAVPLYEQLTAANPTVGLYWWRLGTCALAAEQYEKAIAAFTKSQELGVFQWNPLRMAYHGESAWGLAAAHARLDHRDEAMRWTRTSLAQGLRDIKRFQDKHFEKLLEDAEYRKLVWAEETKGLSRDEGFRHDLRLLVHEAKRIHYAPFRITSEGEFDSLVSRLNDEIPSLSDDQIFVRMMGLMRRLGDGHTQVGRGGKPQRLPVQFTRFPEGVYITAAHVSQAELVGAKVLRIGDRSIDEAWNLTTEVVSRDNPMTVLMFTAGMLTSTRSLRGLGIVPPEGPVSLEIEDVQGMQRRVELVPAEELPDKSKWVNRVPGRGDAPPSLRKRSKIYWFEERPDEHLIYCQINGIGDDQNEPFRKFCARLFEAVAKPEIESLVIDVRYNGGGDTFLNVPLIEGLIRAEKLQKPGRLFVIIGRYTFSAAQNTTDELERRTKAILVGEPTGSSPNFIGESIRIALPCSGWGASVSDLWWQTSMAMDYRIWTHPQLYAPPTAEAFRAHRDVAMETIAAYRAKLAGEKK